MSEFSYHTTYYSNFFVLRVDVCFNKLPVKLRSSDRQLKLCSKIPGIALSMDTLARYVQEDLRKCGYGMINRIMYGDHSPLFQIDIPQSFDLFALKKVIAHLPQMSEELAKNMLETVLQVNSNGADTINCNVETQVYLMCPHKERGAEAILVNAENLVLCLDLWKKSTVSDLDNVFTVMVQDLTPSVSSSIPAVTLRALITELMSVVDWFHLGVYLDIPHSELMKISAEHPTVDQRKTQALIKWMDLREPSWEIVVRALVSMKRKDLATHIAKKYGVPLRCCNEKAPSSVHSDLPIVVEERNNLQSELICTVKQIKNDVEFQENKLKGNQLYGLEMELKSTTNLRKEARTKAKLVEKEMKKLKREKEQLQREVAKMGSEILRLKQMQKDASEDKETLYKEILEKESELKMANKRLEEKQVELKNKSIEAEQMGQRLEEIEREIGERNGRIRELERERTDLRSDLHCERRKIDLFLEKAISSTLHCSHMHMDDSIARELKEKNDEVSTLKVKLTDKEKEVADFAEQIVKLQSQMKTISSSKTMPDDSPDILDNLSLQLQISELREMLHMRESEREEVHAQVFISSKVSETLEKLPIELNALSMKFPQSPPTTQSDLQEAEMVESENAPLITSSHVSESPTVLSKEHYRGSQEDKTSRESETFAEIVTTEKRLPNHPPPSSSSTPHLHTAPRPKPKPRPKPRPIAPKNDMTSSESKSSADAHTSPRQDSLDKALPQSVQPLHPESDTSQDPQQPRHNISSLEVTTEKGCKRDNSAQDPLVTSKIVQKAGNACSHPLQSTARKPEIRPRIFHPKPPNVDVQPINSSTITQTVAKKGSEPPPLVLKPQVKPLLNKREIEREEVHAQVIISSRVSETLEKLPIELNALSMKYPQSPPTTQSDLQEAEMVESENAPLITSSDVPESPTVLSKEDYRNSHEDKTSRESETFAEIVTTEKRLPNHPPPSPSSTPQLHTAPRPKPKPRPNPQPKAPKNDRTTSGSKSSAESADIDAYTSPRQDSLDEALPQSAQPLQPESDTSHEQQQPRPSLEMTTKNSYKRDNSGQDLPFTPVIAEKKGNACSHSFQSTACKPEIKPHLNVQPINSSTITRTVEKKVSQPPPLVLKPQVTPRRGLTTEMPIKSPIAHIPNTASSKLPIIIDNGSSHIRAGFTEDKAPRSVLPTVISSSTLRSRQHFIGEDAQKRRDSLSLKYPIEHGKITNWDHMEKIWNHTFYNELKANPEEHRVLLVESAGLSNREKMVEIMFEKFEVPATYVANAGPLSLFACGKETGVTVSIGDGVCSVMPLYQKNAIPQTVVNLGGCDLTSNLGRLLVKDGYRFASSTARQTLCEIKEKICYVATNPQGLSEVQNVPKVYELPNGTTLSSTSKCSHLCPESLFQPSLLGMSSPGIHKVTHEAIMNCNARFRKKLFSNIILSGGSTMFPGFATRLQNEIAALVPPAVKVKVLAPIERKNLAWMGGAVIASLDVFHQKWIYKQEYEESGSFIVSRCMDSFLCS